MMAPSDELTFDEVFAEMTRLQAILGDIQRSRWMTRWNALQKELTDLKAEHAQLQAENALLRDHLKLPRTGKLPICMCACCFDQDCTCGGICIHRDGSLQVHRR